MYQLYYAPGTAAFAPQMALEEIGADYRLIETEIAKDKPRDPEFLKLNPNGWVPVLVDGDLVIHEAAAIVMYLADRHPEAGLAPSPGDPLRGRYFQWLVYMADCLQVAYQMNYYPERHSMNRAHNLDIVAKARERLAWVWGYMDEALDPGPYLLGDRFSACDLYVYMLATWHPDGDGFLEGVPNVARCIDKVIQRPAVRRAMKSHNLV